MLVLTRKIGEQVVIGDRVRIEVLEIENHRVCLGIKAPKNLPVDRGEIAARKRNSSRRIAAEETD